MQVEGMGAQLPSGSVWGGEGFMLSQDPELPRCLGQSGVARADRGAPCVACSGLSRLQGPGPRLQPTWRAQRSQQAGPFPDGPTDPPGGIILPTDSKLQDPEPGG